MLKANVSEIFQSVQGEGLYVGVKQVFVRFAECNIRCEWCDTSLAQDINNSDNLEILSVDDIMSRICILWDNSHSVSLTGGEPLVQKDFLKELLVCMKKEEMPVYLETNGILFNELSEIIDYIDIISMDIKLPSSTKSSSYWNEHKEFLKVIHSNKRLLPGNIKIVISADTDKEDIMKAVEIIADINSDSFLFLQPNTMDIGSEVISKCLEYQNYCLKYIRNVRIVPQIHKYLKLR